MIGKCFQQDQIPQYRGAHAEFEKKARKWAAEHDSEIKISYGRRANGYSYKGRPEVIADDVISAVSKFIQQAPQDFDFDEPVLLKEPYIPPYNYKY